MKRRGEVVGPAGGEMERKSRLVTATRVNPERPSEPPPLSEGHLERGSRLAPRPRVDLLARPEVAPLS